MSEFGDEYHYEFRPAVKDCVNCGRPAILHAQRDWSPIHRGDPICGPCAMEMEGESKVDLSDLLRPRPRPVPVEGEDQ